MLIKDGKKLEGFFLGGVIMKIFNVKILDLIGDLVELNELILMNIKV